MTQDEINEMLAAALEEALSRLDAQDQCIGLLVGEIERMSLQMDGVLEEGRQARLHYADQRKRLGLSVDLSRGTVSGRKLRM